MASVLLQGDARPYSWVGNAFGFGLLTLALLAWAFVEHDGPPVTWSFIRLESLLICIFIAWSVVQIALPVPANWAHPIWDQASSLLGRRAPQSLSLAPEDGWSTLLRLMTIVNAAWLALQLGRDPVWVRKLFWAIFSAGVVNTLYGVTTMMLALRQDFESKTLPEAIETGEFDASVAGVFVNRNDFAIYAVMCLVVAMALTLDLSSSHGQRTRKSEPLDSSREGRSPRPDYGKLARLAVLWVGILILFSGIVMSGSRLALIVVVGAIAWFAALLLLRGRRGGSGMILTVLLVGFFAFAVGGHWVIHRFGFVEGAFDLRIAVYRVVLGAISENPLAGVGAGAFMRAFPIYRDMSVELGGVWNGAHSSLLEAALSWGIPGACILLIAIGIPWLKCVKGALERRRDFAFSLAGATIGVIVILDSIFSFSVQNDSIALTAAALIGVGLAQSWSSRVSLSDVGAGDRGWSSRSAYETLPGTPS